MKKNKCVKNKFNTKSASEIGRVNKLLKAHSHNGKNCSMLVLTPLKICVCGF